MYLFHGVREFSDVEPRALRVHDELVPSHPYPNEPQINWMLYFGVALRLLLDYDYLTAFGNVSKLWSAGLCCAGWTYLPIAACGSAAVSQHNKFGLLVFCSTQVCVAAVLGVIGVTVAATAGQELGLIPDAGGSLAASDACFLRGDESSIDSPKCQRQLASLQTSRMLRLWLYYHHGAAAGIETYRRRLLAIEEEHSCCGWGAPLRCSPGDLYFNLTEKPEETAALVEDRPDLFWGSSGAAGGAAASNTSAYYLVSPGDVTGPLNAWWKHDLDGDSLLRSDLPAVEAMQRCARAHYGGWFAPSQFCLVSEDGSYRSHEAFDPIPDQSALQGDGGPGAGSGGNLTAEGLAALRPLAGHGGCPYLFPVSATCLAADARRSGCAAPFQRSVAGAISPFAPVALICALIHCLTSCCQCVLVALRKETDRLPPRRPTADPSYFRYGGKRYEHLVDGQLANIAARLPENLRLRPPSRLDREQGEGGVEGEPGGVHRATRDSDRTGAEHEGSGASHGGAAGSVSGGSVYGGSDLPSEGEDEHLSGIAEADSGKTS